MGRIPVYEIRSVRYTRERASQCDDTANDEQTERNTTALPHHNDTSNGLTGYEMTQQ
jgi:hypothetical protein